MEQRSSDVATMVVSIDSRREEFVFTHGAKGSLKRCSFLGCTSYAKKGGVCYRHCSKSINIYNNPLQGVITELPPIPSCQSINYEDEEELNTWIWRSCCVNRLAVSNTTDNWDSYFISIHLIILHLKDNDDDTFLYQSERK